MNSSKSSSYLKEEIGHIPGRMVVSGFKDGACVYSRSVDLGEIEKAREEAARSISSRTASPLKKTHRKP